MDTWDAIRPGDSNCICWQVWLVSLPPGLDPEAYLGGGRKLPALCHSDNTDTWTAAEAFKTMLNFKRKFPAFGYEIHPMGETP